VFAIELEIESPRRADSRGHKNSSLKFPLPVKNTVHLKELKELLPHSLVYKFSIQRISIIVILSLL